MEEAKRTQRQIHMYKHTCWAGTRLTSAEQRAGPPITEHGACGLAPLVRVSAAPCPPSQKQGNGLCYSLLLTLQQTWGWVHPPHLSTTHTHTPLPLLAACSLLSLSLSASCFPFFLYFPLMCVKYPPQKPLQQWRCKSAHVVHFLALPGVHTCSVRDVITARAWEWIAAGLCAGVHFNKFARCHLQHEIISSHVSWDTFKLIKTNSKPATRARAGKMSRVMNWGRLAPFAIQAAFTNRFNKTWLQSNLLFS